MMLVGLPIVVLGHNADIAWGATDMMAMCRICSSSSRIRRSS